MFMVSCFASFFSVLFVSLCLQVESLPALSTFDPERDSLYDAVDLWLESPFLAEERYGHISQWNTSLLNSMSELFSIDRNAKAAYFNDNISNNYAFAYSFFSSWVFK